MRDDAFILEGERLDSIGFGDLRLIQKPEEFCYGIDAVILADFAARGLLEKGRAYKDGITVCERGFIWSLEMSVTVCWTKSFGI